MKCMSDAPSYNTENPVGGANRTVAEGFGTNIFVCDGAMVFVVKDGPNTKGSIHSHPEDQ